jgi:hypothetical protein
VCKLGESHDRRLANIIIRLTISEEIRTIPLMTREASGISSKRCIIQPSSEQVFAAAGKSVYMVCRAHMLHFDTHGRNRIDAKVAYEDLLWQSVPLPSTLFSAISEAMPSSIGESMLELQMRNLWTQSNRKPKEKFLQLPSAFVVC